MTERTLNRLEDLESLLSDYDRRRTFLQKKQVSPDGLNQEFNIETQLEEVNAKIAELEREQAQLQLESETLVGELLDASETLVAQQHPQLSDIQSKLEALHAQLAAPGKTASAKLKVCLPILPTIASYELELDSENAVATAWGKLKQVFRENF